MLGCYMGQADGWLPWRRNMLWVCCLHVVVTLPTTMFPSSSWGSPTEEDTSYATGWRAGRHKATGKAAAWSLDCTDTGKLQLRLLTTSGLWNISVTAAGECKAGRAGGKGCKPRAGGRKSICGPVWGTQLLSVPSCLRSESPGWGCGCSGLGIGHWALKWHRNIAGTRVRLRGGRWAQGTAFRWVCSRDLPWKRRLVLVQLIPQLVRAFTGNAAQHPSCRSARAVQVCVGQCTIRGRKSLHGQLLGFLFYWHFLSAEYLTSLPEEMRGFPREHHLCLW